MTRMFAEAASAADVVARQLRGNAARVAEIVGRLRADPPALVATCARGSSDHAATFAKYLIETRLGVPVTSLSPSNISIYATRLRLERTLAIAISQSGKSPDLLATLAASAEAGADTLALVNVADAPLAAMADAVLPLNAGPELSVAATKSFIAALSALTQLVATWSADDALSDALDAAPAQLAEAWDLDWSPLVDGLADARGLFVVGRGLGLGVACEAALKLKETCNLHAEAFSAAEVRHGPMALIGPGFPLLVLRQSDATAPGIDALVADMVARGGPVFVAGAPLPGAICLPTVTAHPVIEPMLRIQSFYRAANALSLRRGLDPDRPPHLAKVTETV